MTPLTQARLAAGLSIPALAARLGVPPVQLERWESTGRMPPPRYLPALATATGLPVEELFPNPARHPLVAARLAQGWTGDDLARRSGVSRRTLFEIEHAWHRPRSPVRHRLWRVLGHTPDEGSTERWFPVGRPEAGVDSGDEATVESGLS